MNHNQMVVMLMWLPKNPTKALEKLYPTITLLPLIFLSLGRWKEWIVEREQVARRLFFVNVILVFIDFVTLGMSVYVLVW